MSKKKKKNKDDKNKNRDLSALFFVLAAFISAYAILLPQNSGVIGQAFDNVTTQVFGSARYLLPIILLWYFVLSTISSLKKRGRLDFLWSAMTLASYATLIKSIDIIYEIGVSGGWFGNLLYPFVEQLFGDLLGFAVLTIIFAYSLAKLFRVPILGIVKSFFFPPKITDDKTPQPTIIDKKQEKKIPKEPAPIFKDEEPDIFQAPNIVSAKNESKKTIFKQKEIEKIDSSGIKYVFPSTLDLCEAEVIDKHKSEKELKERAALLRKTLAEFDVEVVVNDIIYGPVVTRYDLVLAAGTKIQAITNVIDNLSLAMRASAIRVVPIADKGMVGIEVPNPESVIVGLRTILESEAFHDSKSKLTLALGETTDGSGYVAKLDKMPHLLIAGSTGSGKSVGIHSIILSILFKARPDEVKFMLIDPKKVELPVYSDIPHLYNPCVSASEADIIIKPQSAASALKKLITVMTDRYDKYARLQTRNLEEYNRKAAEQGLEKEFYIVVIIDELADLMLVAKKEIENSIQSLAQMGRAAGIHLILATQRPSVDVITGVIKANFPARISFQTTSKTDSRVILDMMGAENLLGKGDMLFLPPSESRPIRLQGAFVSLKEIENIVSFIVEQDFPKVYEPLTIEVEKQEGGWKADSSKELLPILTLMKERGRISQDLLKANFGGSAKATNILSLLETKGYIAKPLGTNKWQINWVKVDEDLVTNDKGNNNE